MCTSKRKVWTYWHVHITKGTRRDDRNRREKKTIAKIETRSSTAVTAAIVD